MSEVVYEIPLDHAQVVALATPWKRGIEIYVETADGYNLCHDGTWKKVPPYVNHPAPITLSYQNAQQLADQLYAAGIRPTEAAGSAGALSAVNAHLKDLQKLVFERSEK
jgi:hypothetical protein